MSDQDSQTNVPEGSHPQGLTVSIPFSVFKGPWPTFGGKHIRLQIKNNNMWRPELLQDHTWSSFSVILLWDLILFWDKNMGNIPKCEKSEVSFVNMEVYEKKKLCWSQTSGWWDHTMVWAPLGALQNGFMSKSKETPEQKKKTNKQAKVLGMMSVGRELYCSRILWRLHNYISLVLCIFYEWIISWL